MADEKPNKSRDLKAALPQQIKGCDLSELPAGLLDDLERVIKARESAAERPKAGRPRHDGRVELGERSVVDPWDPLGRKTTATVNVRESALDHMASRQRIDATQHGAGDRFRRLWELAAIGRQRGIDYSNMGGGSGGVSDPMTDALIRAGRDLAHVLRALGPVRSKILIDVVGEGKRIEDVAKDWARAGGIVSGTRAEGYITGTLLDAIDELIGVWRLEGAATDQREPASYLRNGEEIVVKDSIRATGPITYSGPSYETYVTDKGDVIREKVVRVDRRPLTTHSSGNLGGGARDKHSKPES